MKFMKLGSKPDAFHAEGNTIRYVSSDLATDVTITVGEVKFQLHKFPLVSKSNRLHKLVSKANEVDSSDIQLPDFPGGPKTFEICAKFCYGMIVTLNPYNVVAARCGAEYLEMSEDVDRGNLILKIEVFLNSSVLRSWKDSIIVLQTTSSLLPWSEELKVVARCVDSIASKTSVDPSSINWSYTYNRKLALPGERVEDTMKFKDGYASVPNDWWIEDICELEIGLYRQIMVAIKSKGRMDANVIGEALKTYAIRWLPDSVEALMSDVHHRRNKSLVETIICLLPSDKSIGCSCSFLLKLLKVAIMVGAEDSSIEDLVQRISLKLDEASVGDLLIPARSPQSTIHDVELVQHLVRKYMMHENIGQDFKILGKNEDRDDFLLGHGSWWNVGKLIDRYLAEIAREQKLTLTSFMDLSQSLPEAARPIHDGLYWAIDIYLKEHPDLTKSERKKLCGLMDVKKLTADASNHAAQNERLPLRVVVQVIFFEQARAATVVQNIKSHSSQGVSLSTTNTDEHLEKSEPEHSMTIHKQTSQRSILDNNFQKNGNSIKKGSKPKSAIQLLPSRSRRILDKLWVVGKGNVVESGETKSSETSGSSQSPTSMVRGEAKLSSSRHSIS